MQPLSARLAWESMHRPGLCHHQEHTPLGHMLYEAIAPQVRTHGGVPSKRRANRPAPPAGALGAMLL